MDLYSIDPATLTQQEQFQLFAFRDAYRPHTDPPPRAMLKADARPYFPDHGSTLSELKEQARTLDCMFYHFLETVYRDPTTGEIADEPEDE